MKHSYSSTLWGKVDIGSLPVSSPILPTEVPAGQLVYISQASPYAILKPIKSKPTETIYSNLTQTITEILRRFQSSSLLTIDLETDGLDVQTCNIYTIGLCDGRTTAYIALDPEKQEQINEVLLFLSLSSSRGVQFNAFNNAFDAAVLKVHLEKRGQADLKWKWDTYTLFKSLANEGWLGQSWGLKQAQIDLLGWEVKGSDGVDTWLVQNGHYTSTSKKEKRGRVPQTVDGVTKWYSPEKSKMYLCPPEILGHYCALDAYSTHLLLTGVLFPSMEHHDWVGTELAFHDLLIENTNEIIQNRLTGFTVDLDLIEEHTKMLTGKILQTIAPIQQMESIKAFTAQFNKVKIDKMAEPKKLTAAGKPSKIWENWNKKREKLSNIEINLRSGKKLIEFFYDFLGTTSTQLTKKGGKSVGVKAMKEFVIKGGTAGMVAKELLACRKLEKELGYVGACRLASKPINGDSNA